MTATEGSRVRLIGLKNPDLNSKFGTITSYTRDGERVMVNLDEGRMVKVKPKQVEVVEDAGGGRGRPGMQRGDSIRSGKSGKSGNPNRRRTRDRDQENFNGSRGSNMNRQTRRDNNNSNNSMGHGAASMGRQARDSFQDNASMNSDDSHHDEVMETLRSADAMFDVADTSKDGTISRDEFEYYMKKNTDHDLKTIRECFDTIDIDNNGDITRDEVRMAFLKKKKEVKGGGSVSSKRKEVESNLLAVSKDADELFQRADVDGSGELSLNEFFLYMKKHTTHTDAAINELFSAFDHDKDGFVTRQEVRKAFLSKIRGKEGAKVQLAELLGLKDDEVAEIEDDVYNMFFLSNNCSSAFWFPLIVFLLKISLIIIVAIDLYTNQGFPDSSDVSGVVKVTQFLLLPVNVSVQEELITTFFLYANLKWSERILELNPGATKAKYHFANFMRALDGMSFLFINTSLLLQATTVIGAFLNFAALGFLSQIDNVALHLARDGYLTENLEEVAKDVLLMTLPKNHNESLQVLDSILLAVVYVVCLVAWILYMFTNIFS